MKKRKLGDLKPEIIVLFVQHFTKALLDNLEEAKRLVKWFFDKDEKLPFEVDTTFKALTYVKQFLLTEELYRKYMFFGDKELSCRDILMESMEKIINCR